MEIPCPLCLQYTLMFHSCHIVGFPVIFFLVRHVIVPKPGAAPLTVYEDTGGGKGQHTQTFQRQEEGEVVGGGLGFSPAVVLLV